VVKVEFWERALVVNSGDERAGEIVGVISGGSILGIFEEVNEGSFLVGERYGVLCWERGDGLGDAAGDSEWTAW
jgi:hypothetical protein